jgi:hypothetical protein
MRTRSSNSRGFVFSTRVKLYEECVSGCRLEKEETRPVSLEPFVSRDQWKAFVDEVNQFNRCSRDSVAGRIANGLCLMLLIGLLLSCALVAPFQVFVTPYEPNDWFHKLLIAGSMVSMFIVALALMVFVAVNRYLTKWRTEQMRAIAKRISTTLMSDMSMSDMSVWFNDEPDDFFGIHFFEFIHPGGWDDRNPTAEKKVEAEKKVDTFRLDNNRINDHHYCPGCRRRRRSW